MKNFTFIYSIAVLESLGDENSPELRKLRFDAADTDMDGLISYDEFLAVCIFSKFPNF